MASLALVLVGSLGLADFVLQDADHFDPTLAATISASVLAGAGGTNASQGAHADGFLALISNAPSHFRTPGPAGGTPCGTRTPTSVTARAHNCRYATNGGPFDMATGNCSSGISVSNSTEYGSGGYGVGFGATAQGQWVIGTLNSSLVRSLNVTEFAVAFSWLVRDGKNVASSGTYIAPRTAIGTTADGRLLSLEVDGCEPARGCEYNFGATETQTADILLAHGA